MNLVLGYEYPEFPYECTQCGRKYKHKGAMQRHMTYECGKPPKFRCCFCAYMAHLKSNLKRHIRRTHTVANFDKFWDRYESQQYNSIN